jgi:TonB family protein
MEFAEIPFTAKSICLSADASHRPISGSHRKPNVSDMIRWTRIFSARAALLALALSPLAGRAAAQSDRDPPIDAVLDSAALVQDVAALRLELPKNARPLFSISFDSTGALDTVRATLKSLPAAYADPVVAAIRARLREQQPSRHGIFTYVRVIAGPEARVDRPRIRERQPELVNRAQTAQLLSHAAQRHTGELQALGGRVTTVVRFRVETDGSADPNSIGIMRSCGSPELDREALDAIELMRFRPAAIENEPVRVWVTIPIMFEFPHPRSDNTQS